MKKLSAVLILCIIAGLVAWRLYEELGEEAQAGAQGPPRSAVILVDTAEAKPTEFHSKLEVLGELLPRAEVEVMSRVNGRLRELLVDRGQEVAKGSLLARVEDEEIEEQIRRAEASLEVTRAGVKRQEATFRNLEVQVKRSVELHDAGLISPQDLEDIQSRLRVSEADRELAAAQVRQAEASLAGLRIQSNNTRIFSPLDGVVGRRFLDPGALVSPGVAIVSILDLNRLKTVVPVSETALGEIAVGQPAEIAVEAYSERLFTGRVTRISPFLNSETRSADIEIETPNPGSALKPGMFARVTIDISVAREVLSIPRSGLIMKGARQGVFVLTPDKTVRFRPVEVGVIVDGTVEVTQGLEDGTRIVTTGAQSLNEGDLVRIQ